MDSTHLRFFNLRGIRKMFEGAGQKIDRIVYKIAASKIKKLLNKITDGAMNERLSERTLIKAVKQ